MRLLNAWGEAVVLASILYSAYHYCKENAFNLIFIILVSWWRGLDCVVKQKNLLEVDGKTNCVVVTGLLLKSL